jgi:hypothetical protein
MGETDRSQADVNPLPLSEACKGLPRGGDSHLSNGE